ncbi:MAG: DNA polymerase III subunit beta [Clostridia bacterium]|nr:DNA polymerase III subunit beta [Clostridia bacterium]
MTILVDSAILHDAASTVGRAISSKPTMPVLEGILLRAENGNLTMTATDLSLGILVKITANIQIPGEAVLQGRLFLEILRLLPKGEVRLVVEGTKATISCGDSVFNLVTQPAEEYPAFLNPENTIGFTISCAQLAECIHRTHFAAAGDETRLLLTGQLFEMDGKELSIVALDGFRLARATAQAQGDSFSAVVPGKSLTELMKTLPSEGEVTIRLNNTHMAFETGGMRVVTRLLVGEYTKYKSLIPDKYITRVRVKTEEFRECVGRVALLAREGNDHRLALSVKEQLLTMASQSQYGDAYEEIEAEVEGETLEICFNAKFLLEILRQIDTETMIMTMISSLSSCTMLPPEPGNWMYILMPVR